MEKIDLYDLNRNRLDRTAFRCDPLPEGCYRLVVHICVFNSRGEMLIQQRQSTKAVLPDKWDITAGGQVTAGETSSQSAERELFEELSIKADIEGHLPHITMYFNEGFDDVYVLTKDIELSSLVLQPDEVRAARWADMDTVFGMIDTGEFISYPDTYIRLLFALQNRNGEFDENKAFTETPKENDHSDG